MRRIFIAVLMSVTWVTGGGLAQESKEEKPAPAKKAEAPAKADAMKCCEGMEKMGEMKSGMPMKAEMKAKMIEMMKSKAAEKSLEKNSPSEVPAAKGPTEKAPASKDAHQH